MVSVVREIPESVSFAVTDAEGTAAPDGSVTLPDKFADTCPCAEREHKTSRDSRKTEKRPPANDMIHPFPGSEKYRRNRCGSSPTARTCGVTHNQEQFQIRLIFDRVASCINCQ